MNGVSDVPEPIPYQGSKRLLAPEILWHFPEKIDRLVEPFAGSVAISIAVPAQRRAKAFWLNDAHEPLVDLWRAISLQPSQLADEYTSLWQAKLGNEREYFNEIRTRFNESHQPADLLYLLARCVKAAIRYNTSGEFNNTPDNRRKGARPSEMR